jgi:hypothetical protein
MEKERELRVEKSKLVEKERDLAAKKEQARIYPGDFSFALF